MNTQRMPGLWTVARGQLGLLVRTKYMIAIVAYMLISLVGVHVLSPEPVVAPPPWMTPPLINSLYVGLVAIGGIAAALAWVYDAPRDRRYHWAMPVPRETHDILRVAAGAIWLMVAIALFGAVALFAEDRLVREQWLSSAPLYWVGLFMVPVLAYLLCTIATLLSGRPLLWLGGAILVALILNSKPVAQYAPPLADVGIALFDDEHPPSLGAALTGWYQVSPWNSGREQHRVYLATSRDYYANAGLLPPVRDRLGASVEARRYDGIPLQPRRWLQSLLVWYVIAFCGIALAVRRRPDV